MQKGFTLIEVLIYVVLLSLIIGGSLGITSQILKASGQNSGKLATQQEANFVLQKIDWALTGATTLNTTISPSVLTTPKGIFTFTLATGILDLGGTRLNSSNAPISALLFKQNGNVASTTLTMNNTYFESAKQLR